MALILCQVPIMPRLRSENADSAVGLSFDIGGMNQVKMSATLPDADNNVLFAVRRSLLKLTADIGFVDLYCAVQHGLCFLHGSADAMAKIPSRLIAADTERALNLANRHSFLGLAEQEYSSEPLLKRQTDPALGRSFGELAKRATSGAKRLSMPWWLWSPGPTDRERFHGLLTPLNMRHTMYVHCRCEVAMTIAHSRRIRTRRINLRATDRQEKLIRTGAETTGLSVTDFILNSACLQAEHLLADKREFIASPRQWSVFVEALDRPAQIKPELARLFSGTGVPESRK